MKKMLTLAIWRFAILSSLSTCCGCDADDQKILPSVIEFNESVLSVTEGDNINIQLVLDKPAASDVSMEIELETDAIYKEDYETDPAADNNLLIIHIAKGEKTANFKFTSVDNARYGGTRLIIFRLSNPREIVRLGKTRHLTLTVADDEGPSLAYFAAHQAMLHETDAEGVIVEIRLSTPAKGEGSITVTMNSGEAVYEKDFTMDQDLINNSFSLYVAKNSTSFSFKVVPIDNDLFEGDLSLAFSIRETSGVVRNGHITAFTLVLRDDELPSVAGFALTSGQLEETNMSGLPVEIEFSSIAKGAGSILVTFDHGQAVYGTDFRTIPELMGNSMTLDVSHGQSGMSFVIFPINNDVLKSNLNLVFSISQATGVVQMDVNKSTYNLTLIDDEKHSVVSFAMSSFIIDEASGGEAEVDIEFSRPAAATGEIIIEIVGFSHQFTSYPVVEAASQYDGYEYRDIYQIRLNVALNETGARFKVKAVNNSECSRSELSVFVITGVSGSIRKEGLPKFELTIRDDEDPLMVTLSETVGTLLEDETSGKKVLLHFSKPATKNGTIWAHLNFYNHYYSGRYTTSPKMVYYSPDGDYAALEFKTGDTGVSFHIFPVDNAQPRDDIAEPFHISVFDETAEDGCVQIVDRTYMLILKDNDS